MGDRTVLPYDYAVLVKSKVDSSTATIVAAAFKKALERKLAGEDSDTITEPGENATDSQRFEFFFHELFDIGPDTNPLSLEAVRTAIVAARDSCIADADEVKGTRDAELEDMYREDGANYEAMLTYFDLKDYKNARRTFWNQDTAPRDRMFMGRDTIANRKLWHRLNEWLNQDRG